MVVAVGEVVVKAERVIPGGVIIGFVEVVEVFIEAIEVVQLGAERVIVEVIVGIQVFLGFLLEQESFGFIVEGFEAVEGFIGVLLVELGFDFFKVIAASSTLWAAKGGGRCSKAVPGAMPHLGVRVRGYNENHSSGIPSET